MLKLILEINTISNTKTDNNQQEANNQTELILKLYNLKRKIANTKDSELKNEYLQIRNIIISQNLQLCATIVYNYCKHNNINTYHQEDLNVEAVIALTNAIEQYNPIAHKNTPLSTIIEQHINEHLNCINNKQAEDLLFNLNTQSPTTNQTDCIINIDNIINSSYNISNAYARTTFINDIINQINNKKYKKINKYLKCF